MSMRILAVNAGSSSLKLVVLDEDDHTLHRQTIQVPNGWADPTQLRPLLAGLPPVDAVGHRIVHGGDEPRPAAVLDEERVARLHAAGGHAPLHQGPALEAVEEARQVLAGIPHVACFDDGFHVTLPEAARRYAVPRDWSERLGVRRRGFHGLSHAYAARRAAELLGRAVEDLRIVTCHLGAGASLAAVAGGISVDTTMGFTPNDGLVMATRSGSVDPGALLWVQEQEGLTPGAIRWALEHDSGLLGLSGISERMETIVAAADGGSPRAGLALDVYIHRLRGGIAAMAAAMNGMDTLVFTGGVGEGSPRVRELACAGLGFLGVSIEPARNVPLANDEDVSTAASAVRIMVVESREDLEIAALTCRTLAPAGRTREIARV